MKLGEFAPTRFFPGHAVRQEGQEVVMGKQKAPRRVADNEALSVGTPDPRLGAEAEPRRRA